MRLRAEVPQLGARFDLLDGQTIVAEPNAGLDWARPLHIELSTELPGGFGPAQVVLSRPDHWDPLQGALFGDSQIFDSAGRIAHEGRVVGLPRSGVNEITIEIEGWSKHLEDKATAKEVFVDIDPSAWGEPSIPLRRQQSDYGWYSGVTEISPNQTTGAPELWQTVNNPGTIKPWVISEYRLPFGLTIGSVYYAWRILGIAYQNTDYHWELHTYSDDADSAPNDHTGELRAQGPGSGTFTPSGGNRNVAVEWWYSTPTLGWDTDYAVIWTKLAVYGVHGLTKRGSESATQAKGLYVSDMVDKVIDNFCPKINSSLALGNVEATTYIVRHAVFREDQTPRSIIESLMLLGGSTVEPLDWAVWEDKQFHMWSPSNRGTDWRVRSDTGGSSDDLGYDVQERPNGVKILYNDGTSVPKSIGPVGSGSDTETDTLLVTDPNHPANMYIGRGAVLDKWDTVDVGMCDTTGATMLGQLYLAEKNRNEWRGSITQQGPIKTGGALVPPYMVRAGDRVVVETDFDTRSRYITGTSYSTSSRTVSMTISPSAKRFDVLLARLQNAMIGIAQGSPHITPAAQSSGSSEPVDYGIPAQFEHMGR